MSVSASISSQPVTATVSGDTVAASVPAAAAVQAAVTGGIGPQGPSGVSGGLFDELSDVAVSQPGDGQVVRYDAQSSQWTNQQLVINGGNF